MKKTAVILILVLSLAAFMGLKLRLDQIARAEVPGASILYIPTGRFLQYASFGNAPLFADLIYLWAIQYFSNPKVADRFQHLEHVFSIIAELDPRYLDPYEIGALIAVYEARDLDKAFRILDLGLAKNPDQWIFPWLAGHYAQMTVKDYRIAQKYYKKAMDIEGAPAMTRRLYANAAFQLTDYRTALQHWLEIFRTAEDDRVKKIAYNQLYRVDAALDTEALAAALAQYRERYGRLPDDLSALVTAGLMDSLPVDLEENPYQYDPSTGEVKAAEVWWKLS
jgi:tetratricopeptide (TPR) repeat protein